MPPEVSVVLPCFEEAGHLPELIETLEQALARHFSGGYEVIMVATKAAGDGTPELARELAEYRPGLRRVVLQPPDRLGYGRALTLGLDSARGEWLLLMDADGQFDPRDLAALTSQMNRAEFIAGRRVQRTDPLPRLVAGALYRVVVNTLVALKARPTLAAAACGALPRDLDCGFKLIRRHNLTASGRAFTSRTGVWNIEALLRAAESGARFAEVHVRHRARKTGRSRYSVRRGLLAGWPRPSEAMRQIFDLSRLRRS